MKTKIIEFSTILFIITVFIALELFTYNLPSVVKPLGGCINSVQIKSIDILIDLTRLFITFSISIIGVLAYFIKENKIDFDGYKSYGKILVISCAGCSIISIYFGHIIYSALTEMLANDYLDITASVIKWSARFQYLFLIFSICILIVFVCKIKK